jgi:hypothetical protein
MFMAGILEFLFGSKTKARLLRFFLMNPDQEFRTADINGKNMLKTSQAKSALNELKRNKFVLERKKNRRKFYTLNPKFPFLVELKGLFVKSNIYPQCSSLKKIRSVGDVKLALISGIFLNYPKSKADLVLVANNVSHSKLRNLMSNIEAEVGKEVSYVLMSGDEFKYRLDMLDRFLLDFLENPHDEVVNKIPRLKPFIAGLKR